MEEINTISHPRRILSKVYEILSSIDTTISLPIEAWNKDLTLTPDPKLWTQIHINTFTMSKNTNLQLTQCKIIHRAHIT